MGWDGWAPFQGDQWQQHTQEPWADTKPHSMYMNLCACSHSETAGWEEPEGPLEEGRVRTSRWIPWSLEPFGLWGSSQGDGLGCLVMLG